MAFSTMEHAYSLVGEWALVTMLVFISTTFLSWNYKWYAYLRKYTPMPEMRIVVILLTIMAGANSWGVWRLWRCENWDNGLAPLLVYLLMIAALYGYTPALMVAKSLWLCLIVSIVACGLAIAYTALSFVEADIYTGIIGVFDIVWALLLLGYTFLLNPFNEEKRLNVYRGIKVDVSIKLPSVLPHADTFEKKENYTDEDDDAIDMTPQKHITDQFAFNVFD